MYLGMYVVQFKALVAQMVRTTLGKTFLDYQKVLCDGRPVNMAKARPNILTSCSAALSDLFYIKTSPS